jgi:hypothetical protein
MRDKARRKSKMEHGGGARPRAESFPFLEQLRLGFAIPSHSNGFFAPAGGRAAPAAPRTGR